MARKSNKTAHVLNLLSGQDSQEEPEKEARQVQKEAEPEPAKEPVQEPEPVKTQTASPAAEVPSNISIIDSGAREDDLLAKRIQEELLKDLEPEPEQKEEAPELTKEPEPEPETEPEPAEEPVQEPEPDYVMLNIMERIVEDKIIYFMKQFGVCTCDRCRADTIALTLNGLPAKYRIVDRHAVDPLISYYTSRLISQVTVEAVKACTQVKENPRHES